jgi:hypothetical protein
MVQRLRRLMDGGEGGGTGFGGVFCLHKISSIFSSASILLLSRQSFRL